MPLRTGPAPPTPFQAPPATAQTLRIWEQAAELPSSRLALPPPLTAEKFAAARPPSSVVSRKKLAPSPVETWSQTSCMAHVGRPGVGLEAHSRDSQWWLVAPVDFKGLERMTVSQQADYLNRVDDAYGELEDSGQMRPPPNGRGYRDDDCLIS